jgi:hypothetical protein
MVMLRELSIRRPTELSRGAVDEVVTMGCKRQNKRIIRAVDLSRIKTVFSQGVAGAVVRR